MGTFVQKTTFSERYFNFGQCDTEKQMHNGAKASIWVHSKLCNYSNPKIYFKGLLHPNEICAF